MKNTDFKFVRFPEGASLSGELKADKVNPAIKLYGRRFYKDQTRLEYLAEFLLAFSSAKLKNGEGKFSFKLLPEAPKESAYYYPKEKIALKLFTFFPSSKLETRHIVHRQAYQEALVKVEKSIGGNDNNKKKEFIKILQNLFYGLVGVANNRTWVTSCFLPASASLIAREVNWEHVKATKERLGKVTDWNTSKKYFSNSLRNFMSRGGESLFLQLANLFEEIDNNRLDELFESGAYGHLKFRVTNLQENIEKDLKDLVDGSLENIEDLIDFIEKELENYKTQDEKKGEEEGKERSSFGWIPRSTLFEAFLFATEIENICQSNIGSLDKINLLQTLCGMQVLRSLCFQARRLDDTLPETKGFIGNYVWIVANPDDPVSSPTRKMAMNSFEKIESMLYRVLRHPLLQSVESEKSISDKGFKNADDNGYRHFNKFAKELNLVIPRKGPGARFALDYELLRFLVTALIRPGENIRLDQFYERIFAHYGIAIGNQLAEAVKWINSQDDKDTYSVASNNQWIEEALKQGGFLVELSDAVSMVRNPDETE